MLSDGTVRLRTWRPADAPWYAAAVRDPEIRRYTSEPDGSAVDEIRGAIAALPDRPGVAGFAVCDAATGELLGNVGLRYGAGAGAGSGGLRRGLRRR